MRFHAVRYLQRKQLVQVGTQLIRPAQLLSWLVGILNSLAAGILGSNVLLHLPVVVGTQILNGLRRVVNVVRD